MNAVAEGEMVYLAPADIKEVGIFHVGRIAIGGTYDLENHFVLREFHAGENMRLFYPAEIALLGSLVAQGFLDRRMDQRGIGLQRCPLLRIYQELMNEVADQVGRRLVAGGQDCVTSSQ